MTSAKPKSRKVAWVVLGVVVVGALVTCVVLWKATWLDLVYQERTTLEIESWSGHSPDGSKILMPGSAHILRGVTHMCRGRLETSILTGCPRGAVRARFMSKRERWLPGAEKVVVFLGEQDEVIAYRRSSFLPEETGKRP